MVSLTSAKQANDTYLVEIRSQEVDLSLVLEQSWPVFLLELFLPQDHLDVFCRVICLRVFYIDLCIELKIQVVSRLLGLGGTRERKACGLEVEFQGRFRNIRDGDCKVDVIFLGLRRR